MQTKYNIGDKLYIVSKQCSSDIVNWRIDSYDITGIKICIEDDGVFIAYYLGTTPYLAIERTIGNPPFSAFSLCAFDSESQAYEYGLQLGLDGKYLGCTAGH